jgi:hypothetical protein
VSQYPATRGETDRLSAGSSRTLGTAMPAVREKLLPLIRQLNFTTTTEQFSVLEAERGSKLGGFTMSPSRVPLSLRIDLDPADEGTTVSTRLEDRWGVPVGRNWGAVSVYANVFTDILSAIDLTLARLDPANASSFEPWWRNIDEAAASRQSVADAAAKAEKAVSRQASKLLDGPQTAQSRSAMDDAGLKTVAFVSPDKYAELHAEDVDGVLTAGQLVAARPGKLPGNLVGQVQAFVVTLEGDLETRTAMSTTRRVSLDPESVPVLSFLYQQAKLREVLPIRIRMVCTTCRLEKVVNPDFARMRERSRRTKALTGSVGAVFGSHHVSPYILVGKLIQVKKTDPDFVCARCQGMDADQTMITFCAQCGDRRSETVLRKCPKCDFDFRTLIPKASLWRDLVPSVIADSTAGTGPSVAPEWSAPGADAPWPPTTPTNPTVVLASSAAEPPQWAAPASEQWTAPATDRWSVPASEQWTAPATSAYSKATIPAASGPAVLTTPAGWYSDPWRRSSLRYWDGGAWTSYVNTDGVTSQDLPS